MNTEAQKYGHCPDAILSCPILASSVNCQQMHLGFLAHMNSHMSLVELYQRVLSSSGFFSAPRMEDTSDCGLGSTLRVWAGFTLMSMGLSGLDLRGPDPVK